MSQNPLADLLALQPSFVPPYDGEKITCNELNYFVREFIANGSFCTVYDCTDEFGNSLVAKVLIPKNKSYLDVKADWLEELDKLKLLRHPRITHIHQAFEYRNTFYLIIEKCEFTLFNLIAGLKISKNGHIWLPYVAKDVLSALHFIHESGYVHKDLHSGNVLVSHQRDAMVPNKDPVWQFKIADLGISRLEGDINFFTTILAPWMVPPEYLDRRNGELGKPIDIYHFGLQMLSLLLNDVPDFTPQEILAGEPRKVALSLGSVYGPVVADALQTNILYRTRSALDLWRGIYHASRKAN